MPHKSITKIAFINRSFWPIYPVIGEALLQLTEDLALDGLKPIVITQDREKLKKSLADQCRGKGVIFNTIPAFTNSASNILIRSIENIIFMSYVAINLIKNRPQKVYVSTDPPILVPFIVAIYCKVFQKSFIYHLQDIHPEAANVVIPVNKLLFKLLIKIDNYTLLNAEKVITLSEEMAEVIYHRLLRKIKIDLIENPAISFKNLRMPKKRINGFSFCGNAGRLQRIPLLLNAIQEYYKKGGSLEFIFAGGGIYSNRLSEFSRKFPNFKYLGQVSPIQAAEINFTYTWALLPIEDSVTNFSFPSKSSTYLVSGANTMAICSKETSVAKWIHKNEAGIVVSPNIDSLVKAFFRIEKNQQLFLKRPDSQKKYIRELSFENFIKNIKSLLLS